MIAPEGPTHALRQLLGDCRLAITPLPGTELRLWLLDPANMQRAFDAEETRRILNDPPYWCFCWASGLAMAQWLAEHPQSVRGQRVLDFGCGSAVVAIAAARLGASQVTACDLDPVALAAARANAELNGVALNYSSDLMSEPADYDLLIAADVLYDRANLPLLDEFRRRARQALVADSRIKDFSHPGYRSLASRQALTLPDLAEPEEFRQVQLYRSVPLGT